MRFIADLHVHSKFSRATAKDSDLEHLYIAAQLKGITLVATGDFTHPAWSAEIREKLVLSEPGLFRLRQDIAEECDKQIPPSCRGAVRFILETEISNIYKKNGKTRKNHNLIYMPDIETALKFNAKLEAVGNIKSDGRPILGLDAKALLSIMLECSPESFLIPAHIWTPWFSLFGSKSGFDSLYECFEDLSSEIFALETGLSSDAPMNWRVSQLDNCTLISDSDSHSPMNLGRNANLFDTELSFHAIRSALKSKDPKQCLGTLDMYPEEGKYHLDGHRKCNLWQKPSESIKRNGLCPICEKPLTLGVLHRVEALADRPEGFIPANGLPCYHIIPLAEILSEIYDTGTNTKKVNAAYQTALEILGPELNILHTLPIEETDKAKIPLLSEAIRRMRAGEIHIFPGYDGEYGKIHVFDAEERKKLLGQESLFIPNPPAPFPKMEGGDIGAKPVKKQKLPSPFRGGAGGGVSGRDSENDVLNEDQRQAVRHSGTPLIIIAGPGAGKTKTLTHRIAYLIRERNISHQHILAVTFTNRAAHEMRDRLKSLLNDSRLPMLATFHSLCFYILKEQGNADYSVIDDEDRKTLISEAVRQVISEGISVNLKPDTLSDMISSAKQNFSDIENPVYQAYQNLLSKEKLYDYDDLIFNVVRLFESDSAIRKEYENRFRHILVDEYQDINQGQYRLIRALSPQDKELCVIGDPDQSIYGFRGSDVKYFQSFTDDYPSCGVIRLTRNYRSAEAILKASHQVICNHSLNPSDIRVYSGIRGVKTLTIFEAASETAEAVAIGKTIEKMVGGTGFYSVDFGKTDETGMKTDRAFSDFAVLYRSHAQSKIIAEIFDKAGIPYQITSRESMYAQRGIKELLSFLKKRNSEFPPGQSVEDRLKYILKKTELSGIIKESPKQKKSPLSVSGRGWGRGSEALKRLLGMAEIFGDDVSAFLNTIALETDPDTFDFKAQKVALMTIHAAKGLEFPIVFIAGCENGYLPFERSSDTDEERRLLYVGMTRAKEQLFLSYAKKRMIYGKFMQREISPYVQHIEDSLIRLEKFQYKIKPVKSEPQIGLFALS